MRELILINRMYAGKYITEGQNIGHEIINLIRCDNGNNYLWLNADGNANVSHFKGYDKVTMLMVRMFGLRKWKVIGKAEINLEQLDKYMVPRFGKAAHEKQRRLIVEENITYGGHSLDEIFDQNLFNGQLQSNIDIYFTFKAKNVFQPVQTKENAEKTIIDIKDISGLSNQSLRMYLTAEKDEETFAYFQNIINEIEWEPENTTQRVSEMTWHSSIDKPYFLKIIREEDRELAFSNLLAYFLREQWILDGFVKEVLDIDDFVSAEASVTREEKNIDLFITSSSHMIILENKIHSGLIIKSGDMEAKIRDYFNIKKGPIVGPAAELLEAFSRPKEHTHTQIDRYYAYAKSVATRNGLNAAIKGYVLAPNYACNSIEKEMEHALFRAHYADPIPYSRLYEYFDSIKTSERLTQTQKKYLEEFLWAMEKHTKDIDNNLEEEMNHRFYQKVRAAGHTPER